MKCLAGVTIRGPAVAEGVAKDDVVDRLVLDEHVGTTDGVGLGIVVLAEERQVSLRLLLADVFLGYGQHATRAACRVVDRARDARRINVLVSV